MRIIGGSGRGRRLATPRDGRIRPTADRVKESLFSILTSLLGNLSGCRVLDICAGTGNLGIEALSRGAAEAVFIDSHRESAQLVAKNLALAGMTDRGRVVEKEAVAAIASLAGREKPFQLVFIDPPYRQGLAERILGELAASPLIDATTVIVAEVAAKEELPEAFGALAQFDRRSYGDTAIAFYAPRSEGVNGE